LRKLSLSDLVRYRAFKKLDEISTAARPHSSYYLMPNLAVITAWAAIASYFSWLSAKGNFLNR
jgi:hypothetical protein